MMINQIKSLARFSQTRKTPVAAPEQASLQPTESFQAGPSAGESTVVGAAPVYLTVTLPPQRSDIVPSPLDLSTSLSERNSKAIAQHMKGDAVTVVAKEVSRVGTRLGDRVGEILEHLTNSDTKVSFVSQALTVNGRVPWGPVCSMAEALTPKEQQRVLDASDSQGYLSSCGFGKSEGPTARAVEEAPEQALPLLETPSGRPNVDSRLKLAKELKFSFEENDGSLQVSDPQGRILADTSGPLTFSTDPQEWPSTARRLSAAVNSATQALVQETKLPNTVKTFLENSRSAPMFEKFLGLSEEEGEACAAQLARLKADVPNSQVPMLSPSDFDLVEAATSKFNCFAHTVGVTDRTVDREIRVNKELPRLPELDGFYREYGFAARHSDSRQAEAGVEKVLVYGKGETPTHVALLKDDGFIYSKLGSGALIRHRQPEVLFGPTYGEQIIGCYARSTL